jgi:Domain of unknown function (DUF4150)/GHH signature containing HNH/Endo VII superfamily nuclease toxin  2
MSNEVYANGLEISCKSGSGKTICAFPDVCFTPPENPATPPGVPIPYPNTGMDSDATEGSKTVKISDKEVMLKNKSYFKSSSGDEAGAAAKKGVVTSVNRGKVYFNAWSSDVKFEGENVVRHLDITTHNHASVPGNSPTWPFLDQMAFERPQHPCHETANKVKKDCYEGKDAEGNSLVKSHKNGKMNVRATNIAMCGNDECKSALKCVLQEHKSSRPSNMCCDKKTTHHLVPSSSFIPHESRGSTPDSGTNYSDVGAPCLCVEGIDHNDPTSEHGKVGRLYTQLERKAKASGKPVTLKKSIEMGAETATVLGCPKACIEAQLKHGHRKMKLNVKENDPLPRQ